MLTPVSRFRQALFLVVMTLFAVTTFMHPAEGQSPMIDMPHRVPDVPQGSGKSTGGRNLVIVLGGTVALVAAIAYARSKRR